MIVAEHLERYHRIRTEWILAVQLREMVIVDPMGRHTPQLTRYAQKDGAWIGVSEFVGLRDLEMRCAVHRLG